MARFRARYALGAIIIILIIALAIGAYCFTRSSTYALHGARYLAGPFQSRALYEMDWRGPKEVTLPVPGHVIDYARENGHEAALAQADDATSVYRIEQGTAAKLVSDAAVKSSIDISWDGTQVAYAERIATTSASTTPIAFYAPHDWEIMLLGPDDAAPRSLGSGFAPHFFTKDGTQYLAYTVDTGLHIVELATNTHQDIPLDRGAQPDGFFTVAVSPDGMYAAVPAASASWLLFSLDLDSSGVFTLAPAGKLPPYTNTVAFSGSRILATAGNSAETLLRLLPLSAPDTVVYGTAFPYTQVYKVIP